MISKSQWNGLAGVVLDAVGTLIEPEPSVSAAYVEAAARQGVVLDRALVKERFLIHFGADEVDEARGPLATDEATERRRWTRIVANVLPELPEPERGFLELWDHFGRPEAWRVFDDVPRFLERLQAAGIACCVGSNFDRRLRTVFAGHSALGSKAGRLVISSEVGYRKPHARFYQAACECLGADPSNVLFVGDDLDNDWNGPRQAGLRACLVDRTARAPAGVMACPSLTSLSEILFS